MRRNGNPAVLIGRDGALEHLDRYLTAPDAVVTVTGPGGIGKSALVRTAVARASHLADHHVVVDLAGVTEGGAVRDAVLAAVDDVSSPRESYVEVLRSRLRDRRSLLVLDGADAVGDEVADLLGLLEDTGDELRIVITRRRPLGFPGETVLAVTPLPVPSLRSPATVEDVLAVPSCQLLVERVRDRVRDWTIGPGDLAHIVTIIRGTAGNPLAIELVASRIPFLGVSAVAERVGPLLLGRRTDAGKADVHEAIEWAVSQLPPPAVALLTRLARTRGPLTLPTIEHLYVGAGDGAPEADELLVLLAESGLMAIEPVADTYAYALPEAVRAYVVDHVPREPTEVCATSWYLQMAIEAGVRSASPRRVTCDRTLEIERLNVLDGLERSIEFGAVRQTAEAVVALFEHWCAKGALRDATVWLQRVDQALRGTDDNHLERLRDQVAIQLCLLDVNSSPKPQNEHLAREVLTRARQRGDTALEGRALHQCAAFAAARREYHLAHQYLKSSTECFREDGSEFDLALNVYLEATLHCAQDLTEDALALGLTAAQRFHHLGETMMEATARHLCTVLLLQQRRTEEAASQLRLVLDGVERSRYLGMAPSLLYLGAACSALRDDVPSAATLLAAGRVHLHPVEGFAMRTHTTARFAADLAGPHLVRADPLVLAEASQRGERLGLDAALVLLREVLDIPPDTFVAQLARSHSGNAVAQSADAVAQLSARELEVLHHVAAGASNEAVAQALDLSRRTVDKHLERIFRKLGVRSRTAASRVLLDAESAGVA